MNPDIKQVDDAIYRAIGRLKLWGSLTPKNYEAEKRRFYKEADYNPQFSYKKLSKNDLDEIDESLSKKVSGNGVFESLVDARRSEALLFSQMMRAVGTSEFQNIVDQIYKAPTTDDVSRAQKILQHEGESEREEVKKVKFLDAENSKKRIEEQLKAYGVKGYSVKIAKQRVRMKIGKISRQIKISSDISIGPKSLEGSLAHEIGVHILRGQNGSYQTLKIFQIGTAGYIGTEEGLAIVARKMMMENPYFASAARLVIATDAARNGSFRDTYEMLRKSGASKKQAWQTSYRVKRGMTDTSKAGALSKDAQYLKGAYDLYNYILAGGNLRSLYVGKISIDDVKSLQEEKSIIAPIHFPGFFESAEERVVEVLAKNFGKKA